MSPVVNKVENQTDHISIIKNRRKSLLDACNIRGADNGSDHHLLMGTITFFMRRNKKKQTCRRKYNLMKIKVPDIQDSLRGKLQEAVSQIESIDERVEEKWMKIKIALNYICENTTGYPEKNDKIWISDSIWNIADKCRQGKIKMSGMYDSCKQMEVEREYASLDKEVKKLIQTDHIRYMDNTASEARPAADRGNIKGLSDSIKCLANVSHG